MGSLKLMLQWVSSFGYWAVSLNLASFPSRFAFAYLSSYLRPPSFPFSFAYPSFRFPSAILLRLLPLLLRVRSVPLPSLSSPSSTHLLCSSDSSPLPALRPLLLRLHSLSLCLRSVLSPSPTHLLFPFTAPSCPPPEFSGPSPSLSSPSPTPSPSLFSFAYLSSYL